MIPSQVAKVNYVGSDSITLGNGIGTVDEDDYVAYKGIAKSDYVLYTAETDGTAYKDTLTKVDVVSGKVDAVKNTTEARIDGTYYKRGTNCTNTPKVNDKVNAAVYAGRYYDLDAVSEASSADLLFVKEAGKISSGVSSGVEATVLFADGTEKTIIIDDIYAPTDDETDHDATAVDILTESTASNYKAGTDGKVYVGAMYTYDVDGSKYDLTPLAAEATVSGKTGSNDAGYDSVGDASSTAFTNTDKDTPRLQNKRIADDAIIFVAKKMPASMSAGSTSVTGADAKVITGKELKTWDYSYGVIAQTLSNTKNGVDTVMVGSIVATDDSYGSESGNYGIITSDPETVKINGTSYTSFKLWNGSEDVVTVAKSSEMNGAKKGSIVKFDTDGTEGTTPKIKSLSVQNKAAAMLGAEANGSKFDVTLTDTGLAANQKIYTANADTTVLFISDDTGVKGGSLADYAAMESSIDDVYVQNVVYIPEKNTSNQEETGDLDLIVIDVRGKLALSKDLAVASNASATATVDLSAKTIVFNTGTASSAITNASVKALFDNALAASKISDGKYTVVANDGSEYTFSVSVAPSAP